MNHITKTSLLTNRVLEVLLKSDDFGDEKFLTVLMKALESNKFRIDIVYQRPDGELDGLAMASMDDDGKPHEELDV